MKRKQRTTLGLQQRLKAAVNISVDIFGIEKQVDYNIRRYMQHTSRSIDIPREQLLIRIFKDGAAIRTCIYSKGSLIREIPLLELITIFMPTGGNTLKEKAQQGMHTFIRDLAESHQIPSEWIQLCITCKQDQLQITAYNRITFLERIALQDLITYFRQ